MASFQPRFRELRYAIGRLLVDRANSLGLTRRELVDRLGFRGREAQGHQMLTAFMAGESVPPSFLSRVADVLHIEATAMDAARAATVRELNAEGTTRALDAERHYRSDFRPHLQVQTTSQIPSPIFAAAMIGVRRLRIVELQTDVTAVDEDGRDEIARDAILRHHSRIRGVVPCFGKITGYVLVCFPGYDGTDFGLPFDCGGRRVGTLMTVRRLRDARLGKPRADGRLNRLLHSGTIQVTQ